MGSPVDDALDRLDERAAGSGISDEERACPDCDGDGYIDLLDADGFVIGPGPCPQGCVPPVGGGPK